MAGESEALAAELKARKEARDASKEDENGVYSISWLTPNDSPGSSPRRRGVKGKQAAQQEAEKLKREGMKNVVISQDCEAEDAGTFFEVSGTGGYQTKQFDTRSEAEAYIKKIMSLAVPPSGKDLPKILEKKYSSIEANRKAKDAADPAEKKRKLEKEIKDAEKTLETLISPAGRKALSTDLYEMRKELKAMGQDAEGIGYEISSNGAGSFNVKLDGKIQKSFKSYSEAETFIDKEQAEYTKKVQAWISKK